MYKYVYTYMYGCMCIYIYIYRIVAPRRLSRTTRPGAQLSWLPDGVGTSIVLVISAEVPQIPHMMMRHLRMHNK